MLRARSAYSFAYMRVSLAELRHLCHAALVHRAGLPAARADAIADVICAAELDGARSHGAFRLPGYAGLLLHGKIDPLAAEPVVQREKAAVLVDGGGGFAAEAFRVGFPDLVSSARQSGIACMSVRRAHHFGACWFECEALAARGLSSIVFTNSKSFVAQPGGNGRRLWGTNPMAFGWPRGKNMTPLVFDQASAAMARGEIQLKAIEKEEIGEQIAVDQRGEPTTDPVEALLGAQLPFGDYKGANVAMMVEVLAAGLTGSNFGFESHERDPKWDGPTENGQFIIAIDPSAFVHSGDSGGSIEAMEARVERLLSRLEEDGGRLPGSRRHKIRRERLADAGYDADLSLVRMGYHGTSNRAFEGQVQIDVPTALHDEIQHIIAGGMNSTQGYDMTMLVNPETRGARNKSKRHDEKDLGLSNKSNEGGVPVILDSDLEEQFVKGSGPGGQKINKVRNCVVLKHRPTGITTRCQKTRSLEQNRKIARRDLALKVDHALRGEESVRGKQEHTKREKKKRKKARAKRRQKSKLREKNSFDT